ncbi:MAG TPA: DUF3370 domain-containing protein [Pantanalinema sp.]
MARTTHRILSPLAASLLLSACAAQQQAQPAPGASPPSQVEVKVPGAIRALPGGLDAGLVFNSNSPEVVQSEGILLSTLPAASAATPSAHLDLPFSGAFSVFSHHIAKDEAPGARQLYVGLLATNLGDRPVNLDLVGGASYLSQPDAVFKPLDPLVFDPQGVVYAGPGDRVATDLLHGRSSVPSIAQTLLPGATKLVRSWSIPTSVPIPPAVNGRTTVLRLKSDGMVYLSQVARFAVKAPDGSWIAPSEGDYALLLGTPLMAGPREAAPTPFDPALPPPKGAFRFGRVAGVSQGDRWDGTLLEERASLGVGEQVSFPIATTYLNRLGTGQNQSAPLVRRYPDTAYQAHGNYGVTYALRVPLDNPDPTPRAYTFALTHPVRAEGDRTAVYLDPPNRPVTFRGPVKLEWQDARGFPEVRYTHLVLRHGQLLPPFETVEVPPRTHYEVKVTLSYPADATPPQLLTIARRQ